MGVNWWMPESEVCDPIGTRFQRFSLEVSDLRAEVTRLMSVLTRNNDGLEIMLEMLRKCQDMDRRIATWLERLDEEYQPHTLYWEISPALLGSQRQLQHASVFPGRVDVYRDLVTANLWNGQRSTRMILGSLIIRVAAWICSPADYRNTPEYATAKGTIENAITGILSSVPFMLGEFNAGQSTSQAVSGLSFACGADEQAKMVGGLMVSWPLSTVRTCDFTTDEQQEWTLGRLTYISKGLGIKYADSLADVSAPTLTFCPSLTPVGGHGTLAHEMADEIYKIQAKIRFPSMLMRRDGLMAKDDPLKEIKATGFDRPIPVR